MAGIAAGAWKRKLCCEQGRLVPLLGKVPQAVRGRRTVLGAREENSMVPSEIPWLKPGRPQTQSKAEREFLEHGAHHAKAHGDHGYHPHPNGATTPRATPLPVSKRKHGLGGKGVNEGFVPRTKQGMLRVWLGGSQTIRLLLDDQKTLSS